jgi:hypothetical protein
MSTWTLTRSALVTDLWFVGCGTGDDDKVADVVGEANARLIAAAPDLLVMLKVAQFWLEVDGRFDMQGINAAIAKAEGRP